MDKSYYQKNEEVVRTWYVVDATDKVLGRMATEISAILRGKNKPTFTPSVDCGDFVVVINADKIKATGAKDADKIYYHHTGYIGGIKGDTLGELRSTKADQIITKAVKGMLPKNKLSRQIITKLKVYSGPTHPHGAQNPQAINI